MKKDGIARGLSLPAGLRHTERPGRKADEGSVKNPQARSEGVTHAQRSRANRRPQTPSEGRPGRDRITLATSPRDRCCDRRGVCPRRPRSGGVTRPSHPSAHARLPGGPMRPPAVLLWIIPRLDGDLRLATILGHPSSRLRSRSTCALVMSRLSIPAGAGAPFDVFWPVACFGMFFVNAPPAPSLLSDRRVGLGACRFVRRGAHWPIYLRLSHTSRKCSDKFTRSGPADGPRGPRGSRSGPSQGRPRLDRRTMKVCSSMYCPLRQAWLALSVKTIQVEPAGNSHRSLRQVSWNRASFLHGVVDLEHEAVVGAGGRPPAGPAGPRRGPVKCLHVVQCAGLVMQARFRSANWPGERLEVIRGHPDARPLRGGCS